jgi:hypothetical protein
MEASAIFIKFLQACITPVAMISGVGLLLLTITNRLGRVIDRTRQLVAELDLPDVKRGKIKVNQIQVLMRRGKLLKNSIAWLMIGMIASCLIIPLLFIMSVIGTNLILFGYLLFIVSILSMLVSFLSFFKDILLSLNAIKLESSEYISPVQPDMSGHLK